MTFPVVLGGGKRLFGDATPPGAWRLVDQHLSTTGVITAIYEPAGAVPIGSFQLATPSAAEARRQDRMARDG